MTDAIKPPSEVVASLPQTQEYTLRAMARNYADGNLWDKLDREACSKAADEIKALRAALTANAPVGEPFGYVRATAKKHLDQSGCTSVYAQNHRLPDDIPVYTHPPVAVGADEIARAQETLAFAINDALCDVSSDGPNVTTELAAKIVSTDRVKNAIISLLSGEKK